MTYYCKNCMVFYEEEDLRWSRNNHGADEAYCPDCGDDDLDEVCISWLEGYDAGVEKAMVLVKQTFEEFK